MQWNSSIPTPYNEDTPTYQELKVFQPEVRVQTVMAHSSLVQGVNEGQLRLVRDQVTQVTTVALQRWGVRGHLTREKPHKRENLIWREKEGKYKYLSWREVFMQIRGRVHTRLALRD